MFDPFFTTLINQPLQKRIINPVWSEIYENLRNCRLNVVHVYTAEYLTILVCGEPDIAKNFISVKQDWCKDLQIHQLLEINGKAKNAD